MIETFTCWRCRRRIDPEELIPFGDRPSRADLDEADLACQAELCNSCWHDIEQSTREEDWD